MSALPESGVDHLRREIDTLDASIQRLVLTRASIAQRIGCMKSTSLPLRPGREARILRELAHRTPVTTPLGPLVGIWRGIIDLTVRMQGGLEVATWNGPAQDNARTEARRHFGWTVPTQSLPSLAALLDLAERAPATLGVLCSAGVEPDPWWWQLAHHPTLRVVSQLPFVREPGTRAPVFVIANIAADPSGRDRTLAVLAGASSSRSLTEHVGRQGGVVVERGSQGLLVDVPGYWQSAEQVARRLSLVAASTVSVVGQFAIPLDSSDHPTLG